MDRPVDTMSDALSPAGDMVMRGCNSSMPLFAVINTRGPAYRRGMTRGMGVCVAREAAVWSERIEANLAALDEGFARANRCVTVKSPEREPARCARERARTSRNATR
jgi:hypothetical protein